LQDRVLHEPRALDRLLGDLSVSVTAMFRDPTFFHTFREKVVPMLRNYPSFRIWHAGCATSEEVYATAIYFDQELQQRALGLFTSSLVNSGVLGLGQKEPLRPTALAQRYEALSQTEKLYRKVA
jgi:chemotaxis protein methyltransferase CheR